MNKGVSVKTLAIIFIFSIATYFFIEHKNEEKNKIIEKSVAEEKVKKTNCFNDPSCANDIARDKSFSTDVPVLSHSGSYFFKGHKCKDECTDLISGYTWAKSRGLTEVQDCESSSTSSNFFIKGCLSYAYERIDEILEDYAELIIEKYCNCDCDQVYEDLDYNYDYDYEPWR